MGGRTASRRRLLQLGGVDWAVIFNNRDWQTPWDTTSTTLANEVTALLDTTLLG